MHAICFMNAALILLACAYPFSCESFREDDVTGASRYFLYADSAIECAGPSYDKLMALAAFYIFIWPLSVPSLFLCLLMRFASRRTKMRGSLPHAIEFLHQEYRDEFAYWECANHACAIRQLHCSGAVLASLHTHFPCLCVAVRHIALISPIVACRGRLLELMRKLVATGFIFLIPQQHTLLRVLLVLLLEIAHLALLFVAAPYRQQSTGFVAVAASIILQCTFVVAILVKMYVKLAASQVFNFFGFHSVLPLAAIIFGFNVSVLIAAMVLFIYQFRTDHSFTLRVKGSSLMPSLTLRKEKKSCARAESHE